MENLKLDLKNNNFKNVYLFFGDEDYLIRSYTDILLKKLITKDAEMMNLDNFEGKNTNVSDINDAIVTLPFLSEYRVIVVKNSGLFYTGRKNDSEAMTNSLKDVPETTIIIFIEDKIDKRGKLFKQVSKIGRASEFNTPPEKDLVNWIKNIFKKENKMISTEASLYLLRTTAHNMENIYKEATKLIDYKISEEEIKIKDIDDICTKALETKIFDLVDAVANKKIDIAINIYNNLIMIKEQPIMILSMIIRQFRLILQSKKLRESGASNQEIGEVLGIRGFVVKECLSQGKNFSSEYLLNALKECLDTDIDIKVGRKNDTLAVETLILKYSNPVSNIIDLSS